MRALATALCISIVMLLVACGGGSDEGSPSAGDDGLGSASDSPAATAPAQQGGASNQPAATQPPAASGAGTFEAGGRSYAVNSVRRCKPFSQGNENLDLQAVASGAILFIVINSPLGNLVTHELSTSGGPGVFSGSATSIQNGPWVDDDQMALPGPPFTRSGDRIAGSMTLTDPRGGSATLDVRFDVRVPADSEILDC